MQNGDGLNPSWYTSQNLDGLPLNQANLILQKPDSSNIYYLFHSTVDYPVQSSSLYLYLTVIDMSQNGGLGTVRSKNQIIINDSLNYGKITACKHSNGRDWWVVCHRAFSDMYYKFLLTPTGLSGPYTQHIGSNRSYDGGQVCFSPDGKKFAYFSVVTEMDIFDFDRCSGMFSNFTHIAINDTAFGRGVAFSPNSQFLYAPSTNYIYQFDVTAANIAATQTTVAVWDSFYSPPLGGPLLSFQALFNMAQLAPDGKIYVSTGNGSFALHIIDEPDSAGLACNFIPLGVQLPFYYFNSLPNHPNYFLGCDTTGGCTTCYTGISALDKNGINARAAPNPNNGVFILRFPVKEITGQLEIFDVMGNVVLKDNIAQWSQYKRVDISKLSNGIYFCKLKWKNDSRSVRVIKD
jgi:hypothetical protein